MYRTLTEQTIHYFSRPHVRILRHPLASDAAWRGSELAAGTAWHAVLSHEEVDELDRALEVASSTSKPDALLTKEDFPLPRLGQRIESWRNEVASGRGFQVIRGVPVDRWTESQAETFFWCFGLHLGVPGAQNPEGDLLGHVRDTGESPERVRHYRTRVHIRFHCDAADVVGLLCLRKAKQGGASRIVSSVTVYNELLRRRPDAVDRLYRPFNLDTKGEGGVKYLAVRPCRYDGRCLRTFYHTDYFRSAVGFRGESMLSHEDRRLLDLYNEIAESPELYLDMDLEPGDVQVLSNHVILHARTGYEDFDQADRKRHLLRLWTSLPSARDLPTRMRVGRSRLGMIGTAARLKLWHGIRFRIGR